MFKDNCGKTSSTKVLSFLGFITFLIVSIVLLFIDPAQFNYTLFAVIAGGGGVSSRVLDKALNVYAGKANQCDTE